MNNENILRVAAAQVNVIPSSIQENYNKHVEFIEKAKNEKVDLLVFPEISLCGYPTKGVSDIFQSALDYNNEIFENLSKIAPEMIIFVGFFEEAPASQFYNTTVAIHQGKIIHIHRKLNLATYGLLEEGKYFTPGRYVETFYLKQKKWRVCSLICADAWNPALVHMAALHGTTLLVLPVNSAYSSVSTEFSNPQGWDLAVRFYGMIYGMPIVMANRTGIQDEFEFWGGSCIVDPLGNIVEKANNSEEELLVADVNYNNVRKARIQLPTVRDSNLDLVFREIDRLQKYLGVPEKVRKN